MGSNLAVTNIFAFCYLFQMTMFLLAWSASLADSSLYLLVRLYRDCIATSLRLNASVLLLAMTSLPLALLVFWDTVLASAGSQVSYRQCLSFVLHSVSWLRTQFSKHLDFAFHFVS